MIQPGDGYKFRNHLADYSIFEDQVLEHMLIGHLVTRRAFGPKLQEDATAFEAVKRQAAASAAVEHWGFPSLYQAEIVEGHYCLYYEFIEGESLEILTNRGAFKSAEAWADHALTLVKLLHDFEDQRIAFDQLLLKNIVYKNRVMRVANRWPVSLQDVNNAQGSRWIQRLKDSGSGGAYVAEGSYPTGSCMGQLKDLLFQMATGQSTKTVAQTLNALQIKEKELGIRAFSQLQLDGPIEKILLRLHNQEDSHSIRTLTDLQAELTKLCPSRRLMLKGAKTERRVKPGTPPPTTPLPEETKPATPTPASATPPSPSTGGIGLVMTGRERIEEDAQEDRSYLYPTAATSAGAGAPNTSTLIKSGAGAPIKVSGGVPKSKILKLVVGMLVAVLVVFGGYAAYLSFLAKKPNQIPTAEFKAISLPIKAWDKVPLDATASFDPEGAELSYTWTVHNLGPTDFRIEPNKTKAARTATLEIFSSGKYELELKVFDGQNFSAPFIQEIEVTPVDRMR